LIDDCAAVPVSGGSRAACGRAFGASPPSVSGSAVDILIAYAVGLVGLFMRLYDFPIAPVILGPPAVAAHRELPVSSA